jgi:8-oxo-(d)GTP phosphatase
VRVTREVAVLLVRHAWAIGRDRWLGDDRERPLDGRGRAQAQALPAHLAALDLVPVRLVTSPTERSRATLAPLARATGLAIHEDERFADEDAPLRCDDMSATSAWLAARAMAGLDAVVRSSPGTRGSEVVVICAHGVVLPALLAGLGGRDGWNLERGPDLTRKAMAKGGAWLLPWSSDQVVVIDPPVIPETTDPGSG